MSSGSSTSTMDTPPDAPAMSSAPLQPATSSAAVKTHDDGIATSPSTPLTKPEQQQLTPSDCRTLRKILDDANGSPPALSPAKKQQDERLLSVAATENGGSDGGNEDEVQYSKTQYGYGDELEAGYEDEDDSMELSDGDLNGHDAEGSDDDGDTIEDIINTPGTTAPPARPQHLDGIYQHESPTCDDAEIRVQRAAIEEAVKKERVNQEHEEAFDVPYDSDYLDVASIKRQDVSLNLFVDSLFQTAQIAQVQSGLSRIEEDDETEFELDRLNANERRISRRFAPAPISRRASEESLPLSSFQATPSSRPTVVATPSGHHLAFTPTSTIPTTSFAKTLKDFKKYSGKENSPSKSRRNASLPEEIAELAKEANEEEDLEKYREIDLAPMKPIMESKNAGDLITFGTSATSSILTPPIDVISPTRVAQRTASVDQTSAVQNLLLAKSPIDSEYVDKSKATNVETQVPPSEAVAALPSLPAEQPKEDKADPKDADATHGSEGRQVSLFHEPPTFVKVVALLPETMFWVAVAPVVKYSSMAYEAMVSQFTKLEL
ncbi:hypothetical protein HBI75_121760 [Parastagonospora nodorum]|nr:hypothetical protein HBH50_004220 [Parastagonospora nodorum]KAH4096205.1 hypothetical protein HBH48_053600 [Parastagonospora nodorum]KAH5030781.1 hypothetical protein HBI75_121760 [Parastagonospora nodorum]KAH5116970.1 hypothetical protein HBH71_117220 [Parastagonospora nodorum]